MAFEMTAAQEKAFQDGAGFSAHTFSHFIFFTIAVAVVLWFFMIFFGTFRSLQEKKIDIGPAMFRMATAAFVLVVMGSLIYFTI